MTKMKPTNRFFLLLMLAALLLAACSSTAPSEAKTLASSDSAIKQAVLAAVKTREDVLAFMISDVRVDRIQYSTDSTLALVWLSLVDRTSHVVIAGEPGLVIARLRDGRPPTRPASWQLWFQADATWAKQLNSVPDTLLSPDIRANYMPAPQSPGKDHTVYTGYKLPWESGKRERVTGSIGHVYIYKSCPDTCLYAFDFADGTMFPVVAAKAGIVKYVAWQNPDGNTKNANFLVLEDSTTTPTTYQVYFHFAQDSIPPALRVPGARVLQGQYLGNADDTGYSTGHHLHFHVHTNKNSYWGTSVDIVFSDVDVNGGRPRTCVESNNFPALGNQCHSGGDWFVSANLDLAAPTGAITLPLAKTSINTRTFNVSGYAKDDSGIASIQLAITSDGIWKPVNAPIKTTPFTSSIDVCQAGIPDGPFFLSMQITDTAGKLSDINTGLTQYTKQFDCNPPPKVCNPTDSQVALFTESNFTGDCAVLAIGEYKNAQDMGGLKDDSVKSIRIGNGVIATLYPGFSFLGMSDRLLQSDADLADNLIGINSLSSLKVTKRPPLPTAIKIQTPTGVDKKLPTSQDALTLVWTGGIGADTFSAEMTGPDSYSKKLDDQKQLAWQVGKLPIGDYNLIITAKNIAGETSAALTFHVVAVDLPSESQLEALPPVSPSSAIHLSWKVLSGVTDLEHFEIQVQDNNAAWKNWDQPLAGQLRSTWFQGELGHTYGFRLRSVDYGGNIEPYPSNAETITSVTTICTADPSEALSDNTAAGAAPLEPGARQEHTFCPANDVDWVVFPAKTGRTYRFIATPLSDSAAVHVQLFSSGGSNMLGEQFPAALGQPSTLDWICPADGIYFLRLTPPDARLAGSDVRYRIQIDPIGQIPIGGLACSGLLLPLIWGIIKAAAAIRARRKPPVAQ